MRTAIAAALTLVTLGPVGLGQPQTLAFEAASIKPNESATGYGGAPLIRPGQFGAAWYSLHALVSFAYEVPGSRITGWPEWTRSARYDIQARTGKPTTRAELLAMLRTLLADRFSLKTHSEIREGDVYALIVRASDGAVGPKLRRVIVDCTTMKLAEGSGPGLFPREARPACGGMTQSSVIGGVGVADRFAAITMAQLATALEGGVGRPVVDKTGLTGTFDAELTFIRDTPPSVTVPTGNSPLLDGMSYRDAIKQQLGLDLRSERGPVEVLVIDAIARPTPD
jgi:uncharacterized protein (TIGR03435 family)